MWRVCVWSQNLKNEAGYRAIKKFRKFIDFFSFVLHFFGIVPDKRQARRGAICWGIAL